MRSCLPPESAAAPAGSTAMMRTPGFRSFRTSPTPVIVPPVPTAETKASMMPSASSRISIAVVRRWRSGFAGLLNWSISTASGISARELKGLLHRRVHQNTGRKVNLGPKKLKQRYPFLGHGLRHRENQSIAAHGRCQRKADTGVATCRLDDRAARSKASGLLSVFNKRQAQPVFHASARVLHIQLGDDAAREVFSKPLQLHKRSSAYGCGDVG